MKYIKITTAIILISFFGIVNAQKNSRERNSYEYAAMCAPVFNEISTTLDKNTQEYKMYRKLAVYFIDRLQDGLKNNLISSESAASVLKGTSAQIIDQGVNSEMIRGITNTCLEIAKHLGVIDSLPQSSQPHNQKPSNTTQTLNYSHGKYVGEVVNGKANGYGTYTSAKSGTVYTGQFIADTFSGDGAMTWTNGSKFVGKWQNDVGVSGTMTYANGSKTNGVVRNGVFTASAAQSSTQQSNTLWNHNDSKMRIDMVDESINIYYSQPRQTMINAGAKPNDLLVNGTIKGTQINGTARIFAGRCGQFTYPVTGNIVNNGREILLNGQAPVVNTSNCQITKYVPDPLSFALIQSGSQTNPQSSSQQQIQKSNFEYEKREIEKLREWITKSREIYEQQQKSALNLNLKIDPDPSIKYDIYKINDSKQLHIIFEELKKSMSSSSELTKKALDERIKTLDEQLRKMK